MCLLFLFAPFVWLYAFRGVYGVNVVLRRGGSIWATVSRDDPRLFPAVRLALSGKAGRMRELTWAEPRPGFAVGELPILVDDMPVDRLLLARGSILLLALFLCIQLLRATVISTRGCVSFEPRWLSTVAILV